jgi:two-component system chemotaxis response regulator CheY
MKIAIADDDQNLLAMLVPYLEHAGHTLLLAANGRELLNKLKEGRADLVVSDINMPGLSGADLYMQVRALREYAGTPFILWSGVEAELGDWMAKGDQKLRFLKKPFSLAVLHKAIDELTDIPLFGDYDAPGGKTGLKI